MSTSRAGNMIEKNAHSEKIYTRSGLMLAASLFEPYPPKSEMLDKGDEGRSWGGRADGAWVRETQVEGGETRGRRNWERC